METNNAAKEMHRGITQRFIASLKDMWAIFGIIILLITILEVSLTFYYDKADQEKTKNSLKSIATSGAYRNADWAEGYFKELVDVLYMPWTPYTHTRVAGYEGKYINVTEGGTRRTWNPERLNGATNTRLTIFFFGGSTLWGFGSRDDFTIPSLVSKKLAENGISAEVTNYAVNADVSTQSLIRFVFELRERNAPDLVVFYSGLVDAVSACAQNRSGVPIGNSYLERIFSGDKPEGRIKLLPEARIELLISDYTRKNLALIRLSKDITNGKREPMGCSQKELDALSDENLDIYLGNVRFIETISKSFSFKALFYLEPQLSDKVHRTKYEDDKLVESEMAFPGLNDLYSLTRDKLIRGEYETLWRSVIYDLHAVFSNVTSQIYIDSGHYSEDGNELIAEKIAADILALHSRAK